MYRMLVVAVSLGCSSCTSISCYYKPSANPPEAPIGTVLVTKAPMVGMLDEWIDDSSVHYLNVTPLPGYSNRFVKKRIEIPVETRFEVIGARKATNPMCHWQDPELVLKAETALEPTNSEIHMDVSFATDATLSNRTLPAP